MLLGGYKLIPLHKLYLKEDVMSDLSQQIKNFITGNEGMKLGLYFDQNGIARP